ncbi:MAG TPA: pilin [Candidatus Moranbacteria bacterium]|nr:pilin [Candidatus Moranbacteria bacterium]
MRKLKIQLMLLMFSTVAVFMAAGIAKAQTTCTSVGAACTYAPGQPGTCQNGRSGLQCYPNYDASTPSATAPSTGSASGVVEFTNPLRFTTVEGFLGSILLALQRIIVTLALVFIVIGAVLVLTSAGSPDMVERGKKSITAAIIGLAIGIAAPSILKELAGILGWGPVSSNCNPGDVNCESVDAALTLSQIAVRTLNFLLGIAGILALIMIVIGGIVYLTSAGDPERADRGKKTFTYSVIGIIIALSAMVIIRQIAEFFAIQ